MGLSILSGSHAELVPDVLGRLREAGAGDVPVIVGGIIPSADAEALRAAGVAAVFTPKDFGITEIIGRIVDEIRTANKLDTPGGPRMTGPSSATPGGHSVSTVSTSTGSASRPRRSCLAVPGSNPRFLEKAQGLPADQVFLDLEDACAPLAKPERPAHHREVPQQG